MRESARDFSRAWQSVTGACRPVLRRKSRERKSSPTRQTRLAACVILRAVGHVCLPRAATAAQFYWKRLDGAQYTQYEIKLCLELNVEPSAARGAKSC